MNDSFQLPPTHSLIIALETSRGMAHRLPGAATTYLQAALAAIERHLAADRRQAVGEYALIHFGDERVNAHPFTTDHPAFMRPIRRLTAAGGAPLAEALRQAQHMALDEARGDEVRIVVLSLGFDTCGGQPLEVAIDIGAGRRLKWTDPETLAHKTVRLELVGLGVAPDSPDAQRLTKIARAAGGRFIPAAEPEDLTPALAAASGLADHRLDIELPGEIGLELARIEPGEFLMGSPVGEEGRDGNEGPQHPVRITRPFFMARTPVTMAQWQAVTGTRPWNRKHWVRERPDHPATWITWHDVQDFIARLNQLDPTRRYRMPTEAEWEYACRAGTRTPWFFGEDREQLSRYTWWFDNSWSTAQGPRHPRAVGVKEPNPWGLCDLYGNVAEWVQDRYGPYRDSLQIDPQGAPPSPTDDEYQGQFVIRGGRYGFSSPYLRSAVRMPAISRRDRPGGLPATEGSPRIGARLVVEIA